MTTQSYSEFSQINSALPKTKRPNLRQRLLVLASAAVVTLTLSAPVYAQNNDVDAFDGTVNGDCTGQSPITATPTNSRYGNAVSGEEHCVGNNSSFNQVSGTKNTLGTNSVNNNISGRENEVGADSNYNAVSGALNTIGTASFSNLVSGQSNNIGQGGTLNIVGGG